MARKRKESLDVFRAHMKELNLAYARLTTSPAKRLEWLLNFAQEEWSNLSRGQLSDRRYELIMFLAEGVKPEQLKTRSPLLQGMVAPVLDESESEIKHDEVSTLKLFYNDIKKGIAQFFSSGWTHEAAPIKTTITFNKLGPEIEGEIPSRDYFVEIAFNLVKEHQYRIHKCERCQKVFVERRAGRGRFCSRQCQAYVKLKNWRAKSHHGEAKK